jgi:hypothetical protein
MFGVGTRPHRFEMSRVEIESGGHVGRDSLAPRHEGRSLDRTTTGRLRQKECASGELGDRVGQTRRHRRTDPSRVSVDRNDRHGQGGGSEGHGSGGQDRSDRSMMTTMTDFVTLMKRNRNIPVVDPSPTRVTPKKTLPSTRKPWSQGILLL